MSFSSGKELQRYFDDVVSKADGEIVKVCTISPTTGNAYLPVVYMVSEPLYILFENAMALVINYCMVGEISIEYRKLTQKEQNETAKIFCRDLFNTVDDIYDYNSRMISKRITLNMDYGRLESIAVKPYTKEYEEWHKGEIVTRQGTEDSMGELIFSTDTKNTFTIRPVYDCISSDFTLRSDTAYENIKYFKTEN